MRRVREIVGTVAWYALLLAGAACAIFLPIYVHLTGPNPR